MTIHELQTQISQALTQLNVDTKEQRIASIEQAMASPDFWNDQDRARRLSKEHAALKQLIEPWRELANQTAELAELKALGDEELAAEISTQRQDLTARYSARAFELKLSGPYDQHAAIVSLHSGAGGTDAQDWTEMLERMYLRFSENQGWKTELIDRSPGDEAGIKHATYAVRGPYAYGKLKSEHGVHRLVRLSPFNADNLRQTSFAMVEVLPEIDQPDEVELDEADLKVDVYRAGGKGGQSVNTTDSAVRITHQPTGTVVAIQNERSQLQNKQTAMNILRSKLAQLQLEQHAEQISELKGPDVDAAWGNQIRNYVMHPYTLVKDTRTSEETSNVQAVLDGALEPFVETYLSQNIDK